MSNFKTIAADKSLNQTFKVAKEEGGNTNVPDGEYVGALTGQREREHNGAMFCNFDYKITEGKYKGRTVSNLYWIGLTSETDNSLTFSQMAIAIEVMGGDISGDNIENLDKEVGKIIRKGNPLRLLITTNKRGFQNVKPRSLPVTSPAKPEEEEEEDNETEDSIIGGTITFYDEKYLVTHHDIEESTVTLRGAEDETIWYEDLKIGEDITKEELGLK